MTVQLGLIGHPVRHSPSPAMHRAACAALGLDWSYSAIDVAPGKLPEVWPELVSRLSGANVTTPHKEVAAAMADRLTPEAAAAGSVNTLVCKDGAVLGATTDGAGFMRALAASGRRAPSAALILGAGGAARAVAHALAAGGSEVAIAARHPTQAETVAGHLAGAGGWRVTVVPFEAAAISRTLCGCELLVNATTAGSLADPAECPLPREVVLPSELTVFDLIYGPHPTELLRRAAEAGCLAIPGVEMLVHQAALSLELWCGCEAPLEVMRAAAVTHLEQLEVKP